MQNTLWHTIGEPQTWMIKGNAKVFSPRKPKKAGEESEDESEKMNQKSKSIWSIEGFNK